MENRRKCKAKTDVCPNNTHLIACADHHASVVKLLDALRESSALITPPDKY
jgi:hypothetical protein